MSETKTWWCASVSDGVPEPVQVVKETPHRLTILDEATWRGPREMTVAKSSDLRAYFPTEEEAAGWLIRRALTRVRFLRQQLDQANGALGNLRGKYRDHPAFKQPA